MVSGLHCSRPSTSAVRRAEGSQAARGVVDDHPIVRQGLPPADQTRAETWKCAVKPKRRGKSMIRRLGPDTVIVDVSAQNRE